MVEGRELLRDAALALLPGAACLSALNNRVVLFLTLLGVRRVGTDCSVGGLANPLERVTFNVVLDVLSELGVVRLLVFLEEVLHVLSDVAGVDVLGVNFGVEFLGLVVVSGEPLLGMRHRDPTVNGALQDAKDTGTGGAAPNPRVKVRTERAGTLILLFLAEVGAIDLFSALVGVSPAELGEDAAGQEQSSGVGSGVVVEPSLHAVPRKLGRMRRLHHDVTLDG